MLCFVFMISLAIVGICYFTTDKDPVDSIDYRPASARWLMLPLFLCLLYHGAAWTMAKNAAVSQTTAKSISKDELKFIYENAAGKEQFGLHLNLSQNPNTPPDILQDLAFSEKPSIRVFVAKNSNTPNPTVEKLADDDNNCVRQTAFDELKRRNIFKENAPDNGCNLSSKR